ncbi:AsmA family protein [Seohaeicola saemankumensis]|nr:AsmA family protein [Seohaeicola saemankumensis]MCA0873549.1 AsmA family protein [Seohaeicola saemankumensis]
MMRWGVRILAVLAGLAVLLAAAAWLLLSSSLLEGPRGKLTSRLLQQKLNQDVRIDGGVQIDLGPVLHITARDLTLPSRTVPDRPLARLGQLDFDIDLSDLMAGRFDPQDIRIAQAALSLTVDQAGTASWGGADKPKKDPDPGAATRFLADHRIRATDTEVTYTDARNGLDFDLKLATADLGRTDPSAPVALKSNGTLNGQELTLTGDFRQGQPFQIAARLSGMTVQINGTPDQGAGNSALGADLTATISDLGQLLDVLKLEGDLQGTGKITARLDRTAEGGTGTGEALFQLTGGQSLHLTAEIADLNTPKDISIGTNLQLYPEDAKPPATTTRRDLKLVGVDMQLISRPGQPPLRTMLIETNGFVLDTGGEGPPPIVVSQVSRTPDGLLRLGKAELRIGPPAEPFFILNGSIADVLHLQGFDFDGQLSTPAGGLIAPEFTDELKGFGQLTGGVHLTGNAWELRAENLDARTVDTDLWDFSVSGSVENVYKFETVDLAIETRIGSGADVLKALRLKPIKTGPLALGIHLTSKGQRWASTARFSVEDSALDFDLNLDADRDDPVVRGAVTSDLIKMAQVRNLVDVALQFGKIDALNKAAGTRDDTTPQDPAKPPASGPFRNVTLLPLGRAILLAGMDLEVDVDLKKIEGVRGTSSLKSELQVKDSKASFGPLKFAYGGGRFDVSGAIDLGKSPDILSLKGSTSGWDFNHLLQELKFKKGASGKLRADFDLSGPHATVRGFLTSMTGNATVSMRDGSIDTQLLDLAGLGVVPWLFSKHPGKSAPIVCLRAPLHVANGRISTKQSVIETSQVQIVVYGDVDVSKGTIDVIGQPRRIGKPLSRSPWPFTATGALAKPRIKVKDGPRKLRRSDGASTMPRRRQLCVPDILQLK